MRSAVILLLSIAIGSSACESMPRAAPRQLARGFFEHAAEGDSTALRDIAISDVVNGVLQIRAVDASLLTSAANSNDIQLMSRSGDTLAIDVVAKCRGNDSYFHLVVWPRDSRWVVGKLQHTKADGSFAIQPGPCRTAVH